MLSAVAQLSASLAFPVLLVSALLYVLAHAIRNHRRLRHFNGPRLATLSRHWLLWHSLNARVHRAQHDAIQKYGPVCRIASDLLVTGDADIVRHMNAPGSAWRRSGWYSGMRLDPRLDSIFSTRSEKRHAELKAKEAGGEYIGRDIDTLEPSLDARITDLVHLIKTEYHRKVMDVASVARFFTLDVLSTVAFGRPFGFMAANCDLWDYGKTSSTYLQIMEFNTNHPSLRWLLSTRLMQFLFAPRETDATGMGPMLKFARTAVAERYGPDAIVKKDMLGHFVAKGLDQVQCEAEANLQILAGSDSTTTVLRTALFLLTGTPRAYSRLQEEVDNAVPSSHTSGSIIRYSEAQKLPYLTACIWETLRMYPPLFGFQSKLAPAGGETVKGIFFPGGTEVAVCDEAIGRRRDIFGDDADIFRPERWLEIDSDTHRIYHQAVDTMFGSGRFLCLGKHIAMMEIYKTLFVLFEAFEWILANPMEGISTHAYGIHVQSNMNMVASPRK